MSAETSIRVGLEMDVETVEMEDGLVEVGAVSEMTKGAILGISQDTSGNGYKPS